MMNYSTEIAQAVKAHLEKRDMKLVAFDEENGIFGFHMHMPREICYVYYTILVHDDSYTVLGRCPVRPADGDEDAIRALGEFVHRANHGLRNGNFEMDYDDGELRYKAFVNCDGVLPSDQVIRDSIAVIDAMFKRYAPGIIDVVFRGKDPKTAVKECESHSSSPELTELRRMLEERLQRLRAARGGEVIDQDDEESEEDSEETETDDGEGGIFSTPEAKADFLDFLRMMAEDEDDEDEDEDDDDEDDDSIF